ncbi:hypothetical protein TPHA_0B03250 [Tetrapisispora phaffii CBS 4417]|uniref:Bud site selection protein RAX2 n=1 Tax=Tetrapisispora phaffii (strain ATCC 24235 / CBS 4417 / NBRC 1672 / NRRL Y-8282 / UCD 70-5) TaxID=1071381 RepID=G8BPR6_TETPH|nr:hypothetical protein TPHA_0B03250 [Tetrapisispora phaffii CBS 4417]CCE61997.1 hypothetical protein TPHA_0B03250 [Tetrapisispora phaffii CBS 4417]
MSIISTIVRLVVLFSLANNATASSLSNILKLLNIQEFELPNLNFNNTSNSIQLLGDVENLQFYHYEGQQNFTDDGNSGISSTNNLIYYSDDVLIQLEVGSNDTDIQKIIPVGDDSFVLSGSGHLNGYALGRQLLYNLTTLSIKPIFDQDLGNITSILVDEEIVYFGGEFTYQTRSQNSSSVISWNMTSDEVIELPFQGFGSDSKVNSILKLNDDNILFVGMFDTLGNSSLLTYNTTSNFSNFTNSTENSSTIQLEQQISLKYATWDAGTAYFDQNNFVCEAGSSEAWIVEGRSGNLQLNFPNTVSPSKIRIYNANTAEDGVSLFRIVTSPSNGIMNLTYVDPLTGQLKYCDAFCPLLNSSGLETASSNSTSETRQRVFINNNTTSVTWSESYQEFAFINNIDVSALTLIAQDSYGSKTALSGIELFQDSHTAYANNTLNQPGCDTESTSLFSSSVLSDNGWYKGLDSDSYIAANYQSDSSPLPTVQFYPNIQAVGDFSIKMYTPGCLADGTCESRSIVNVTVLDPTDGTVLSTQLIYQNNNEMKYDEIFNGKLTVSPEITLTFYSTILPDLDSAIIVADRVDLTPTYINVDDILLDSNLKSTSLKLNGLFQYQLSNFTSDTKTKVGNNSIHQLALSQFPSSVSLIGNTFNNSIFLAGSTSNIVQLQLNSDLELRNTVVVDNGGETTRIENYSQGLLFFGQYNISSTNVVDNLSFNGTFSSFSQLGDNVTTFANFTYEGSELLFFNNDYLYNVSSESYIYNNTMFTASVLATGANSNNDTLLLGNIVRSEYSNFNEPLKLYGNSSLESLTFSSSIVPYAAVFLNDTANLYAYKDGENSKIIYGNNMTTSLDFSGTLNKLSFSNNSSLLFANAITNNGSSSLVISNISDGMSLASENLNNYGYITSMIDFNSNNTILVSGNFTLDDVDCHGICLYNYFTKKWSAFANSTIKGSIVEMQLWNSDQILISGLFSAQNYSSITLASLDIKGYNISVLSDDSKIEISSFIHDGQSITVWSNDTIMEYKSEKWNEISFPNTTSKYIESVEAVSIDLQNSTSNVSKILFAYGEFNSTLYGRLNAMLFRAGDWKPYFSINNFQVNEDPAITLFENRDLSSLFNSKNSLPANITSAETSSRSTVSSATATTVVNKIEGKHSKIDRGFVVLIALALAVGTVALLGLFGVTIAYIFRDEQKYESIKPRIDGQEMLDTVPPEKLMKFI